MLQPRLVGTPGHSQLQRGLGAIVELRELEEEETGFGEHIAISARLDFRPGKVEGLHQAQLGPGLHHDETSLSHSFSYLVLSGSISALPYFVCSFLLFCFVCLLQDAQASYCF